jgi:integrase
MAIHKLTPRFVATVTAKGMHADGGGLYLQVGDGGKAKSWIFRYHVKGRGDRQMGLGPLHTIGLAEARDRAAACRVQRLDGIDPIEASKAVKLAQEQEAEKQVPFHQCANEWVERNSPQWGSGTKGNNERIIRIHLNPLLGELLVSAINIDWVEKVVGPIWEKIPPHAAKVLRVLARILSWAKAKGYRTGDNPADPKGPISARLKPYVHKTKHNTALPYQEMGAFMAQVRNHRNRDHCGKPINRRPVIACLMEFVILTAVRHGQARSLRWDDIDWNDMTWTCRDHKTVKQTDGQPHVIPLSKQAMTVLATMREQQATYGTDSKYVFARHHPRRWPIKPSRPPAFTRVGKRVTQAGLGRMLIKGLGRRDLTIHGFRTAFRSWAKANRWPREDAEAALAHIYEGQVERIYTRDAELLEPRRKLMQAWADYCDRIEPPAKQRPQIDSTPKAEFDANVIPIRRAAQE